MRCRPSKGSGLGTGRGNPRLLADPPFPAISIQPSIGWLTSMPKDQDLFSEEQSMVTMSFGEHIEELRVRLILGTDRAVRRRRDRVSFRRSISAGGS